MKYMGSKRRIAKELLSIILKDRQTGQWYVEPFCGGCNIIDKVGGNRIASDVNEYLIALFEYLQTSVAFPFVDELLYKTIQNNKDAYPKWLVGYVGFNLSFGGKWFGGYRRDKAGQRDYQNEAQQNLKAQQGSIRDVVFYNLSYLDLPIPPQSIIYCDPPYSGTTGYRDKFNHTVFWQWVRERTLIYGDKVYISEYSAPSDFICLWEKEVCSSLTTDTGAKRGVEKLFTWGGYDY